MDNKFILPLLSVELSEAPKYPALVRGTRNKTRQTLG